MAFSIAAEIERDLISQRTKEALLLPEVNAITAKLTSQKTPLRPR